MNAQDISEIAAFNTNLGQLRNANTLFLEHLASQPPPSGMPASIKVVAQKTLQLDWAGFTATAVPRVVRNHEKQVFMEYLFTVQQGEDQVPLAGFYVAQYGKIFESPYDSSSICDSNEDYALQHLSTRVLKAILNTLFKPTSIT